jgi:hypothetical protein
LIVTTIQGLLRDDYDAWHQAVSALALGPSGWIQMLNLVVFGTVLITTVPAWRLILAGGKGAGAYPVLTAMVGISFVAVGLVPQDPAPGYDPAGLGLRGPTPLGLVHLAFAGVAATSSVAGLGIMAVRFARDAEWRWWTLHSALAGLLMIVCVTVYGIWSTRASGFAGTFERAAIVIPLIWMYAFLHRLGRGTPFMTRDATRE